MELRIAVITAMLAATSGPAWGICRVVQEAGSPPPVISPAQSVLLIKHDDVVIRSQCGASDAGPQDADIADAAYLGDGGDSSREATPDAGDYGDAGVSDGGQGDAGEGDAGETPGCEEIRGEAVTMIVQPEFTIANDGSHFALLMVTPSWPLVSLAEPDILHDLAVATSPQVYVEERLVEDASLGYQCSDPKWNSGGGCGGEWTSPGSSWQPPSDEPYPGDAPDVPSVETIGAYEVVRLEVSDTDELADWLGDFGYVYADADLQATRPYIEDGWTVVAVRVRHELGHHGGITPLSFSWAGNELRLPTGISVAPPPSESHLTVYVSAEQRYDFPQSHISYAQPVGLGGRSFLTRNDLWVDLSLGASSDPIAFASSGLVRETVTVDRVVRIPSSDCPRSERDNEDGGCGCTAARAPGLGSLLVLLACAWGLRRRRRR